MFYVLVNARLHHLFLLLFYFLVNARLRTHFPAVAFRCCLIDFMPFILLSFSVTVPGVLNLPKYPEHESYF